MEQVLLKKEKKYDTYRIRKKLLEKLLQGENLILQELRSQYKNSTVSIEFTGVGFFTDFNVHNCKPIANGKYFQIGDINAFIDGDDSKIGFILFIKNGFLSLLEGYTISLNEWPEEYNNIVLKYNDNDIRDLEELRKIWA